MADLSEIIHVFVCLFPYNTMFVKKVIAEECLATMNKLLKIIRCSDFALKKKSILYCKNSNINYWFCKTLKKKTIKFSLTTYIIIHGKFLYISTVMIIHKVQKPYEHIYRYQRATFLQCIYNIQKLFKQLALKHGKISG